MPAQARIDEDAPRGADFLPVRTELRADLLHDISAPLEDADDVAEPVPPVLEAVVALALRHAVEFDPERFHFVAPPPRGDGKVALRGELVQARMVGEQRG